MKLAAPFALALLLLSCTSATDVIDERTLDCSPGQDLSIMAGIGGQGAREHAMDDRIEILVDVANNSHEEVTVSFVRVDQTMRDEAPFRIENSYRKFDQVIPEGEDHTFQLPTRGSAVPQDPRRVIGGSASQGVEVVVTVGLTNGDSYRCQFAFPIR